MRGLDDREVKPDRKIKSVSAEDTFSKDLTSLEEMNPELEKIATHVFNRLERNALKGKTLTLKIKFSDFKLITRSKSADKAYDNYEIISQTAKQLLADTSLIGKKIRLLGIGVTNFGEEIARPKVNLGSDQLELF